MAVCYNLPQTQTFPVFSRRNDVTRVWDHGRHCILTRVTQCCLSYRFTLKEKSFLNSKHFAFFAAKRDPLTVLENSRKLLPFTGNALSDRTLFQTFFQRAVALSATHLHGLHKSSTTLLHFHPTVQLSFELFKWMHLGNSTLFYLLTH